MTLENEIEEIKNKLADHEKRIKILEGYEIPEKKGRVKEKESILDRLCRLKSQGFFDQPKLLNEIVKKLATEGYHYRPQSLTSPLERAIRSGILGRVKKENKWAYCKR
jgi:ppGpp synthetase/RelA/SpoT-type nucleotidyltranferase